MRKGGREREGFIGRQAETQKATKILLIGEIFLLEKVKVSFAC